MPESVVYVPVSSSCPKCRHIAHGRRREHQQYVNWLCPNCREAWETYANGEHFLHTRVMAKAEHVALMPAGYTCLTVFKRTLIAVGPDKPPIMLDEGSRTWLELSIYKGQPNAQL